MVRRIRAKGIWIFANNTSCAHACAYCSTGKKRFENISFSQLAAVVERFEDWRQRQGMPDFEISFGIAHSYNYDVKTLSGLLALRDRINGKPCDRSLSLGGLHFRPEAEMRDWLQERRDLAGIDRVHASVAGHGARHDRWNGRRGDFDFLMRTMRSAADLGLQLTQRLFVVKSTLPLLDELIERLDDLPGYAERQFSLFYYRGFATKLEGERITEEIRGRLPSCVLPTGNSGEVWRSEREWIDIMREEDDPPTAPCLKLFLTDDNIAQIESSSCDAIFAELLRRTQEAYHAIPSRTELYESHADRSNTLLYSERSEVEAIWLDRHLAKHPVCFERNLTHLWRDF